METQQAIAHSLFDTFTSGITGGVIPDFRTGIFFLAGSLLIIFAVEIISYIVSGVSLSDRASGWVEDRKTEVGYQEYKRKRNQRADYADRYEAERRGKNDAEAGMAYLQKQRKNRP